MPTYVVECRGVASEAEFWSRYVEAVRPGGARWFGRNLDAFWDAVDKGGPGWPGGCSLRFLDTHELRGLGDGLLLRGLRDIARDATAVRISLE